MDVVHFSTQGAVNLCEMRLISYTTVLTSNKLCFLFSLSRSVSSDEGSLCEDLNAASDTER